MDDDAAFAIGGDVEPAWKTQQVIETFGFIAEAIWIINVSSRVSLMKRRNVSIVAFTGRVWAGNVSAPHPRMQVFGKIKIGDEDLIQLRVAVGIDIEIADKDGWLHVVT